jgi:hypothetical protein
MDARLEKSGLQERFTFMSFVNVMIDEVNASGPIKPSFWCRFYFGGRRITLLHASWCWKIRLRVSRQ